MEAMKKVKQIMEAEARLAALEGMGLHENVRREFKEDATVYYSEPRRLTGLMAAMAGEDVIGVLYWLDNKPEWAEKVRQIEEETGVFVYHATNELTEFGELLSLFVVTQHEEEWESDRAMLKDGEAFCYVLNLDEPDFSEFGYIGFMVAGSGIVRTY